MATIDLIVLGMLQKENLSAYEIQKLLDYRNISRWVKISTPSVYKKVIQLEKKGYVKSEVVKEGKMPEKSIYSLTKTGKLEFEKLMIEISLKPISIFMDFNSVIVNLENLSHDKQIECISSIENNLNELKLFLESNFKDKKEAGNIPKMGMNVLEQQLMLVNTIEKWLISTKSEYGMNTNE